MKVLLAVAVLSLLVSCNHKSIDGMLKVFTSFTLTDEDGYDLSISEGKYEAEFSYKLHDAAIELEIDDVVAGYDRDFVFSLANLNVAAVDYSVESHTEQMRLRLPASVTGQTVDAEVVISNTIISKKPPRVYWDRCNAYYGIKGGLRGLLGLHDRRDSSVGVNSGSVTNHIYTVAALTESQLSVAVSLSAGEETVALFEGTKRMQYRDLLWEGECGAYERPVIRRD